MDAFITAEDVSHIYEQSDHLILANITLNLRPRAFVALVGPSGVGKTTLLRILGGLLTPTHGAVTIAKRPVAVSNHAIGIVFQQDNLMPWRTVRENIRLPLEIQGGEQENGRIDALLELVGLTEAADYYPAQLSGGMAQRVALARALVHDPQVLLLDEPFGALDALTRERMGLELLRIWQARPVTVLMVTHSIMEAVFLADQVVVMNGRPGQPATLTHMMPIPIERPRRLDHQSSEEFLSCVAAVRHALQ